MRGLKQLGLGMAVVGTLALAACGDGEDRPGQVTSESESGSGTGSASGTGSVSGTGHGAGEGASFGEDEADSVVEVTLTDYAFAMPATVKGPKVYFEAVNDGAAEHELMIEDASGKELAEIEAFGKADGEKHLALELPPGSYKAVCLVEEGAKTHRELGMEFAFTVE